MAAVKPIEYKHDSSSGIAKAGESADITPTNANAVQKDVNQGFTVKPDVGQQKALERYVDEDETEYTAEEMKQVGTQQVNAEDTENSSAGKTVLDETAAVVGGGVAAAAGAGVGGSLAWGAGILSTEQGAEKSATIPFAAVISGAIALAGSAMALVAAKSFDDQYGNRMAKKNESQTTNTTIQQYYDDLIADMDAMTEDSDLYTEMSEQHTAANIETITEIGALQGDILTYQAQGNTQKVAELNKQIADIKKENEEDSGVQEEMNGLKENIETYTNKNAEAAGVSQSGSEVAEFLSDGQQMGIIGEVNAGLLAIATLISLKGSYTAAKAAMKAPFVLKAFAAAIAVAGAAMFIASSAVLGSATLTMHNRAKDELSCADAGAEMQNYVNNLNESVEANGAFTESTSALYVETDTAATEEVAENQEETDKALGKQAKSTPKQPVVPDQPVVEGPDKGEDE